MLREMLKILYGEQQYRKIPNYDYMSALCQYCLHPLSLKENKKFPKAIIYMWNTKTTIPSHCLESDIL